MIKIRQAAMTLLQDTGRIGYEHIGVPVSGAFDLQRHTQALNLLSLPESAPTFEILGGVFEFMTNENPVMFSIVGPAEAHIDGQNRGANHVLTVGPHNWATIRRTAHGEGPIYVAVLGMQAPTVLGSSAHDTLSKLGPAPVAPGDEFPVHLLPDETFAGRFIIPAKQSTSRVSLRVVPGPHVDASWPLSMTVGAVARSGIRLNAHSDLPQSTGSLASLPVTPGTIQLPPSGEPIILGPDSGVTGGYPVLGVVISADLPVLARLRPQQTITLIPIEAESARDLTWNAHVTSVEHLTQY